MKKTIEYIIAVITGIALREIPNGNWKALLNNVARIYGGHRNQNPG